MKHALYALALIASPAAAEPFVPPSEYVYQALNLADMGETLDCRHIAGCYEANPLLGKHPSDGKVIGFKLGGGVIHFLAAHALRHDAKAERVFEFVSIAVQGGVVAANVRMFF